MDWRKIATAPKDDTTFLAYEIEELLTKYKINDDDFQEFTAWLSLDSDTSILDGDFTSAELRRIADAMDELKERINESTSLHV